MTEVYELTRGSGPLLVSVPHAGTELPPAVARTLTDAARELPDTDWHVPAVYRCGEDSRIGFLVARYNRYLVDLNRPPDGGALYPGRSETELCPTTRFDGEPVYRDGASPGPDAIRARVERYWRPYHQALGEELARIRSRHGFALLWEAHSIRSEVPRFFDGRLPDFNFGTDGGRTCPDSVPDALAEMARSEGFTAVVNGRFRGGFITRFYGDPGQHIYALQLELSQRTYMEESPPWRLAPERVAAVASLIGRMLRHWADVHLAGNPGSS